jgi:hypothetical protein
MDYWEAIGSAIRLAHRHRGTAFLVVVRDDGLGSYVTTETTHAIETAAHVAVGDRVATRLQVAR